MHQLIWSVLANHNISSLKGRQFWAIPVAQFMHLLCAHALVFPSHALTGTCADCVSICTNIGPFLAIHPILLSLFDLIAANSCFLDEVIHCLPHTWAWTCHVIRDSCPFINLAEVREISLNFSYQIPGARFYDPAQRGLPPKTSNQRKSFLESSYRSDALVCLVGPFGWQLVGKVSICTSQYDSTTQRGLLGHCHGAVAGPWPPASVAGVALPDPLRQKQRPFSNDWEPKKSENAR